jgi:hypothetical protein
MEKVKLVQVGKIVKISDKQMFDSGAGKLTFRLETDDQYNKLWEFELFKGAAYIEHLDNFTKYNAVGDNVEVEFDIRTNHHVKGDKDSIFTSLGAWKVSKLEESKPAKVEPKKEDLPF